jgi:RNA 2',3'-cyclic 3'-phosphodiesterase
MRLFIAITLSESIKTELQKAQHSFRLNKQRGNFTSFNNLHLTLVFIGESSLKECEAIEATLEEITSEPFELTLGELGCFNRKDGEIWWVGIKPNESLMKLQKQIRSQFRKNNIPFEDIKYVPHITLVRNYRAIHQDEPLRLSLIEAHHFKVTSFSLMKSERIHEELQYTEVSRFTLKPLEEVL